MDYKDVYFLNPEEALRVATQQNRKENGYWLQVCYYDGEKIDSDLPNLIHLPLDNLIDDLALGIHRIPEQLNFSRVEIADELKEDIFNNFQISIEHAHKLRNELNKHYIEGLKNAELDFSEPLRFYLSGHASTQVMQYVSKNIVDTLQNKGYEVLFNLNYGAFDLNSYKVKYDFNPHVTININHFENFNLAHKERFSFIWFQDVMPILTSPAKTLSLYEREYVFSLLPVIDRYLIEKNVPFQRQSFCINTSLFRCDKDIEKKKKIVFIGSSYLDAITEDIKNSGILDEIKELFYNGKDIDKEIVHSLSSKYNLEFEQIYNFVVTHVIRVNSVIELCKLNKDFEIEIYGYGWEDIVEVKNYFKGELQYGKDLVKVYNSAKYVLSPHPHYILQQRVLEAAACGAIPVVYDCRNINSEDNYDRSIILYKSIEEMKNAFTKEVKNLQEVVDQNSYSRFVDRIMNIIKNELTHG